METFSALLAICAGNSPVPGEFPTQRPVTRSFDVYFDLRPTKRLSKQYRGWWFETLSPPLWRHRNGCGLFCFSLFAAPFRNKALPTSDSGWFGRNAVKPLQPWDNEITAKCGACSYYRKTSSINRTKSQNLNVSCIPLQLSSLNPLKPGVKLRMKM